MVVSGSTEVMEFGAHVGRGLCLAGNSRRTQHIQHIHLDAQPREQHLRRRRKISLLERLRREPRARSSAQTQPRRKRPRCDPCSQRCCVARRRRSPGYGARPAHPRADHQLPIREISLSNSARSVPSRSTSTPTTCLIFDPSRRQCSASGQSRCSMNWTARAAARRQARPTSKRRRRSRRERMSAAEGERGRSLRHLRITAFKHLRGIDLLGCPGMAAY